MFSGAAGSSALWWWADYVEPRNRYTNYRGLSRFVSSLNLPASEFVPTRPVVTTRERGDLLLTGYPRAARKPHLVVTVDGVIAYSDSPPAHSTVAVPLSAGRHSIFADNTGTGWVEASDYRFTSFAPTLKAYALQGPTTIAAWVVNRNYNFAEARKGGTPKATTGVLHFRGLENNGPWKAEWRDTSTGLVTARTTATVVKGAVDLPVPATATDRALKMTFAGARRAVKTTGAASSASH